MATGYRQNAVEVALASVGLHNPDEAYLDLIAPNETKFRRAEMGKMYSCALTVLGIWRRIGVTHPLLSSPYVNTKAISNVLQVAHDYGAILDPKTPLEPGMAVLLDEYGSESHVYTVVDVNEGGSVTSVDGGQRIDGEEGILQIQRIVTGAVDHRLTTPQLARPVSQVIDPDLLFR